MVGLIELTKPMNFFENEEVQSKVKELGNKIKGVSAFYFYSNEETTMTTLLKKYQTIIVFLLSFMVPVVILFLVFLSQNIYWNSERTILASDGFHQYVIFAQNLRNILHGSDSIFYTFTSGLG